MNNIISTPVPLRVLTLIQVFRVQFIVTRPSIHSLQFLCSPRRIASMALSEGRNKSDQFANEEESKGGMGCLKLAGIGVQGISVAGQETCIVIPSFKVAFDIGRCPAAAIPQHDFLISHAHLDHLGGIGFLVGTRELLSMPPPRVVLPSVDVPLTLTLLETYKRLDRSWDESVEAKTQIKAKLFGINVDDHVSLKNGLFAKSFKTYHTIPSQGYIVYSRRKKLKAEFVGLPPSEICRLKTSGVEITDELVFPEVAFTGDSTADWITDPANQDALRAKLLIMEATFIDDSVSVEHARTVGHTCLSEVVELKEKFQNEAILFIHFSARYKKKEILQAMANLPEGLREKSHALTERFS